MTDPHVAIILREFPDMGKYKVRLMQSGRHGRTRKTWLDVREYASGPNYEGFTRRGVKITTSAEARHLREVLEIIDRQKLFD